MSSRILPRKPAFATLHPNPPEFVLQEHRDDLAPLLACVGPGRLLCRVGAPAGLDGYYLHQGESGGTSFLKVVPADHAKRQSDADAVADWVARFGVQTPTPLPDFPRMLGNEFAVFAYRYIPSRFADATPSDLSQIGASLATMHAALRQYPGRAEVRQASARRIEMLSKRRHAICSGSYAPGPEPKLLHEILEVEAGIFPLLEDAPNHQVLHGDLVYGNIFFPLAGGAPVLLDFEDALITWLPIDVDIALVLERFVLVPEQDDEVALMLGREMLQAYGKSCGMPTGFLTLTLSDSLRLLSVRALTLLAEFEAWGGEVDISEWEKFFGLYQHAVDRTPLLERLQEPFFA